MNTIARVILVAVLAPGSGCAKPDWIQQTLVTVDVTGVWVGSMGGSSVVSTGDLRLELEQQGPNVKGYFRRIGGSINALLEGPIDGTVGGDVFSFRLTNGTSKGEMTVSGDEMKGNLSVVGRMLPISLRRADSSAPPRSQ